MSSTKENLLLKLIHCYAKSDPDHSYQIAQRLSSPNALFQAAQIIRKEYPGHDLTERDATERDSRFTRKLDLLFIQAFEAKIQEDQQPSKFKIPLMVLTNRWLEFAEAFHLVKNRVLESRCIITALDALELMNTPENTLTRIKALCRIAEYCHKTFDLDKSNSSIKSAQELLDEKMESADLIQAHLVLADTFFSIRNFEKMDQELGKAVDMLLLQGNELLLIENIYSLKNLIIKIGKHERAVSRFREFAIEPLVVRALQALTGALSEGSTIKDKERTKAYLRIANIYQDKLINNDPKTQEQLMNTALNLAFKEIQSLPENTDEEIESKIDSLTSFTYFYKQDPNTAQERMQILEHFYDRILPDSGYKFGFGKQILKLYNTIGLEAQSERFFQKYLLDLQNGKNEKVEQVSRLVIYASFGDHGLEKEQTKAQLAVAETLLSQLTSIEHKCALEIITEGYLKVDRQKSLKLLENYENQQARSYLIAATAIPIIMGVLYVYPQVAPLLSLGFTAARLF